MEATIKGLGFRVFGLGLRDSGIRVETLEDDKARMSYGLNSFKGVIWGLHRGVL